MRDHIGRFIPGADGVITVPLSTKYANFELDFRGLTPTVDDDKCNVTFLGTGLLFFLDNYNYCDVGSDGGVSGGTASNQTQWTCGHGVLSGIVTIQNKPVDPTPGIFGTAVLTNAAGSKFNMLMLWWGGSPAISLSVAFPGGMRAGTIDLFGLST